MENAYNEGYFYFDPEDDGTFPPYPVELNLTNENEYIEFDTGYTQARTDFLWEYVEDFVYGLIDLLVDTEIEIDTTHGFSIDIEGKTYKFYLSDFEDYLDDQID